jgi:hypothetical protein
MVNKLRGNFLPKDIDMRERIRSRRGMPQTQRGLGRPRKGRKPRIGFSISASPENLDQLKKWDRDLQERVPGASMGDTLDWLIRVAKEKGFNPKDNP